MEDLRHLEERILARIKELEANVTELEELREVAARLGILGDDAGDRPATGAATATTRPRRTRRSRSSGTAARTGGVRSVTAVPIANASPRATRRERVLEVVGGEPGISVRDVVAQLGVNRTSLYPVVRQLVSDGLLYKDGRGLWPVSS